MAQRLGSLCFQKRAREDEKAVFLAHRGSGRGHQIDRADRRGSEGDIRQVCRLRAPGAGAAAPAPRLPSAAPQALAGAAPGHRAAAASVLEAGSVPSDHEVDAHAVPGSQADTVRLRQAAVARHAFATVEARPPQSSHFHANDQDARRSRSLPQLSWLHIPATRWCY